MAITNRKATFTFSITGPSALSATVHYATQPVTAFEGQDYAATQGTLTFAAGEMSKTVDVPVDDLAGGDRTFRLVLSDPSQCKIADGGGLATIRTRQTGSGGGGGGGANPGGLSIPTTPPYSTRFDALYAALKSPANGYYSATGVPYHSLEGPVIDKDGPTWIDWGHESSSSEMASAIALEAWRGVLHGDNAGLASAWNVLENVFIRQDDQRILSYDPSAPSIYTPDPTGFYLSGPQAPDATAPVGYDPLYSELSNRYGTTALYLMHRLVDADGVYGFKNRNGSTVDVLVDFAWRGFNESIKDAIPVPTWDSYDQFGGFANGGGTYGYQPIAIKGHQLYSTVPTPYFSQWGRAAATAAEAKVIQATGLTQDLGGTAAYAGKATRMGDYLRYGMFDRHFRKIGDSGNATTVDNALLSCHFLVSEHVKWTGSIALDSYASSRLGSSFVPVNAQAPNVAYRMWKNGPAGTPAAMWLTSLFRQLEFIRWCQSPSGLISGIGVTNCWGGNYGVPTGADAVAKFYGMYAYADTFVTPPSKQSNSFLAQIRLMQRLADLLYTVAGSSDPTDQDIAAKAQAILDRWIYGVVRGVNSGPLLNFSSSAWARLSMPTNVGSGKPGAAWDGTGDTAAFWRATSVPSASISVGATWDSSTSVAHASALASTLLLYAAAKRKMSMSGIDISAIIAAPYPVRTTSEDILAIAWQVLDIVWDSWADAKGLGVSSTRAGYINPGLDESYFADPSAASSIYKAPLGIPANVGGSTPNGEALSNTAKFGDLRTFQASHANWNSGVMPRHRYSDTVDYAVACALANKLFGVA